MAKMSAAQFIVYSKAYGDELEGKHGELWHFEDIDFAEMARTHGRRRNPCRKARCLRRRA